MLGLQKSIKCYLNLDGLMNKKKMKKSLLAFTDWKLLIFLLCCFCWVFAPLTCFEYVKTCIKRKDRKGGRNVVELSAVILKRHKKYTHSFSAISNTNVAFYVMKKFRLITKTTYTKHVKRHCAIFFVFANYHTFLVLFFTISQPCIVLGNNENNYFL